MISKVNDLYKVAAGDNQQALQFLNAWHDYCHAIDDFIDNNSRDPEKFVALLAKANMLYTFVFYRAHAEQLVKVVVLVTNSYADSLAMGLQPEQWKKQWADTLRFCGNEMVKAVAHITGGWQRCREISETLNEWAWSCHHDEKGKPI